MNRVPLHTLSTKISSGLTPLRSNAEFWNSPDVPWVKTEQLGTKNIYDSNEKISQMALDKTGLKLYPVNTLSVAMYGEGKTRGSVSIFKSEMTTNQACCNIEIDASKADYEYVYYYLTTQYNQLRNLSSGVRKNLNSNDIKNFEINIPEKITLQRRIASVLSSLDAKIELNNHINAELEQMAKTLYDYWFVQFDFPNEDGKPYKASGGKMIYNSEIKREIPEGWTVKKIKDELDVQYGFPFSTKSFNEEGNGYPVIRIRDILNNSISIYSTEKCDDRYRLHKCDLIIGMDGNFHMNFWDKTECYLNQRCVRIRKTKSSRVSQFQVLFSSRPYIQAREKNVSRTTVGHLSAKDIDSLYVLVPNSDSLISKCMTFDNLLEKLISNRIQNQALTALRDWLLPMLMNGQITVKEAEGKVSELGVAAEPEVKYDK